MTRLYGRIVALHITIIFGAFLIMAFDSPLGLLVILMVLKTSVDLATHPSVRNKFQGQAGVLYNFALLICFQKLTLPVSGKKHPHITILKENDR